MHHWCDLAAVLLYGVQMANRKHRRLVAKRRRVTESVEKRREVDSVGGEPLGRIAYSREEAARALGISVATLDRRVVPVISTIVTEWGRRLIPASELDRYIAARIEKPRRARTPQRQRGRRSTLAPEVVSRIRDQHASGRSLGSIARQLNDDGVATGQGGRLWWPSTVRAVLHRST